MYMYIYIYIYILYLYPSAPNSKPLILETFPNL